MLYAIDKEDKIVGALPGLIAFCRICKIKMVAKCGDIRIWHWAHSSGRDCDNWAEPESDWHRAGKLLFPKEFCEVVVIKEGIRHRADIKLSEGTILKFHKKTLTEIEMTERQTFYGQRLICLFEASTRNKFPDYYKYFNCLFSKDSLLTFDSRLYYDFQKLDFCCTFKDISDNPDLVLRAILSKNGSRIDRIDKPIYQNIQKEIVFKTFFSSLKNSLSKNEINLDTGEKYTYLTYEQLNNLEDYWDETNQKWY